MDAKGRAMLEAFEARRAKVYPDAAGLPTIGVGHLLTRSERASGKIEIGGELVRYCFGLSEAQMSVLFVQDFEHFERCVDLENISLEQTQFNALVSFAFNVGCKAFRKSTLLKKIRAGEGDAVPDEFRRWIFSSGERVAGLVSRREVEIACWEAWI